MAGFFEPDAKLFREIYPRRSVTGCAHGISDDRVGPGPISAYLAEEALQQFFGQWHGPCARRAQHLPGQVRLRDAAEHVLTDVRSKAGVAATYLVGIERRKFDRAAAAYDLLLPHRRGDARLNVGPHRYGAEQVTRANSGRRRGSREVAGAAVTGPATLTSPSPVLRSTMSAMPREAAPAPAPKSTQEATQDCRRGLAPGTAAACSSQ